ncbi:MAG: hypothetical protein HPZ91_07775 [Lentisphaeria bacterium]|nr:hypothetical protein [Lentisphaeria bacterium]
MHPVLMFIASGWIFWSGTGTLLAAVLLGIRARRGMALSLVAVAASLGALQIAVSSVPVSGWIFWPLLGAAAAMVATLRLDSPARYAAPALTAALVLAAAAFEVPYWPDNAPAGCSGRVWVLADSISSGIGFSGETVWSTLLDREHPGRIVNRAVPGSKVVSSLKILKERFDFAPGDVLLIELGGNDMLGGVPGGEFHGKLDGLLAEAAVKGVPVVMFELPLPPFRSSYLRAQRQLAAKYRVTLIPRRRFAAVFRGPESVVDGLHLSNYGHEKMAGVVAEYIRFGGPHSTERD